MPICDRRAAAMPSTARATQLILDRVYRLSACSPGELIFSTAESSALW